MTPSARALSASLLIAMEGLRLAAYRDGSGTWTIGVGSTYLSSGRRVQAGDLISHAAALELAEDQAEEWAAVIARCIHEPLSDNWTAALVSFVHQEGVNALPGSVLGDMLNAKLWDRAAGQLNGWVLETIAGVRAPQLGIMRRMEAQRRIALGAPIEPTRTQVWTMGSAPLLPLYHAACADALAFRHGVATWEVHPAPTSDPADALNSAELNTIEGA